MKAIEDEGATPELVSVWLGAALGDTKRLNGRKPDFAFFAMLLDRTEGKVPNQAGGDEFEEAEAVLRERLERRKSRKPPG